MRTLLAVGSEPPCSCYPGLADGQGFRRAFAALNPNDKEKTSSATPSVPKSAEQALFLPLNRLKKSPKHVRNIPHTKAEIEAIAASIAAHGLLQNLGVEAETSAKGKPTGDYLVTAGEGRRRAVAPRQAQADHKQRADPLCARHVRLRD